jgi:hypothetical protein
MRVGFHRWLVTVACLAFAVGCGSSSDESPRRDGAPDALQMDTPPSISDGPNARESYVSPDAVPRDAPPVSDGMPDAAPVLDVSPFPVDGSAKELDVGAYDLRGAELVTFGPDGDSAKLDAGTAVADGPADAPLDGFTPAPATPIVVNSGNTATYNLVDGTWKVFYFDAVQDQLYCISGLSGIVRGYVSSSATVSPTSYQYVTDPANGTVAFTASATQRYYVAAISGGGASGSFQVADGGQRLAVGANSVALAAPDLDNTSFFRFPISKGHSYSVSVAGPSTTSVSLVLTPLAERAGGSQFLTSLRSVNGPLPFADEAIPSTSVDLSYSGFYYFSLRVYTNMTVTVTITQTS